ncbi:YggS family pyridoxal phosphate-dependent enzyme [Quatrionicoccus australiensis]|uniref:YggS family pyridoxal phosphate-dependent enzyme n=1 Tax=Quatrionicoccus australiensis TaxID=138118 RepID=UPI001CFC4238|nr:YggS family pyridoxal phosphate-dependent enzyme [Quatrionicoccus australiensis]MCB4359757.1 YggS family pyridoxal phosphate-dependent enzyme [Quatrionicoccus australiensis]
MSAIATNLQAVRARIATAASAAGRTPESIALLAVSKTKPLADVLTAAAAGQIAFGENYVQEGCEKAAATVGRSLEWHFIGPLQSNKTRLVAEHFAWVHSVDRLKIAERLSAQRPADLPPLQVCVQVNVSGEASKSGCTPDEALALCQAVATLPNLRLRGLMTIPEPTDDVAMQRAPLRQLREIYESIRAAGLPLDTLSMGMTHDLEAAIAEGATIVRVGTAIFGERNYT